MLAAGVIVAAFAVAMIAWNIRIANKAIKELGVQYHPDNDKPCSSYVEDDVSDATDATDATKGHTKKMVEYVKAIKREEHFAGLPPGALTPHPYRSIWYGRDRQHMANVKEEEDEQIGTDTTSPRGR